MSAEVGSASPPAPDSSVARVWGVLIAPVRTFEAIARRPTWLAPLAIWTILSLAATAVVMPRMDWDRVMRANAEKRNVELSEQQLQQQIEGAKKFSGIWYGIAVVSPAVISLIVAAVYWMAFKAFGSDLSFRQSFGVTTHGFLPGVAKSLLVIPLLLRQESIDPSTIGTLLRSNLSFLIGPEGSGALKALLGAVDVFYLWGVALLVVGYAAAARVSRGKAAGIVLTLWVVWVLILAGLGALGFV